MKKALLLVAASFTVLCFVSFDVLSSSGETSTTGSPGEGLCNGCHGGGAGVTTISISSTPAFTNNAFDPQTSYTINVTVSSTALNVFGFDCEILNPSNVSTGTMSLPGTGVKLVNGFNGRRNAVHSVKKTGVSGTAIFSFVWTSPLLGDATFYASGNAVNNNGNTGGDNPSGGAVLTVTNVNTSVAEINKQPINSVVVYPNPSSDFLNVSYVIDQTQFVTTEITEITGKKVKTLMSSEQNAGPHSHLFDLNGIASGIYFVKISSEKNTLSQKLITVN